MLFDSKSSLYLFYSWFVNSRTLRISFHSFIENELFYIKMVNYSNLVYKSTKYLVYNRYSNILNHSFSAQNFLAFLSILSHITTFLLCYWCLGTCPCFVLDSGSWTHVFSCVYVCVYEFLNVLSTCIHGTDPINVFSSKKFWDSHPKRRWWKDLS